MVFRSRLISTAAALLLLCCHVSFSTSTEAAPKPAQSQLIVKFRPEGTARDRERALRNASTSRELGTSLNRQSARGRPRAATMALSLKEGVNVSSELARLAGNPAIEYAEPNYRVKIMATPPLVPNDFEFSKMYALLNLGGAEAKTNADIHATEAWRFTTGDKRVIVAVIDTGVDYLHEDLRDNLWTNEREIPFNGLDDDGNGLVDDYMGYDFVSGDSDPFDDNEHGTHVAGIIGARGNNEIGIAGVCWNVSLMALKAFDEQGNGTVENAIAAIEYAVRNGARVINASWGLDEKSRALEEAVQAAADAGVLLIAAAGNNRTDAPSYPASFESVVSVAASDRNDTRAIFSNFGSTVDIVAPGDGIFSTLPENRYGFLSGTSMAAPHVSGVAALVLARFPKYTRQELYDILINSVDRITFDQAVGNGRLDANRAVQMDQPLPTARLNAPATLSGEVVLTGTATGSYAKGYTVLLGSGKAPSNWVQVSSSPSKVTNSEIARIDTAVIPDGPAVVQLIVTNQNGAVAVASSSVRVLNALITTPLSGDVLAPAKFEITGTVYGQNKSFELYYGQGLSPKDWIKLPTEPNGTILNGKLGEWDASTLPNGPYSLRLVSWTGAGTNRSEFLAPGIFLDGHLRAGWPKPLETDNDFPLAEWRNVRAADLDGDGKVEFVVVEPSTRARQQKLVVLNLDGSIRWSKELGFDIPPDVPAIGDIDHDGKSEIFVDGPEEIFAFHADGSPVAGWPVKVSTRNHAKVLADLGRDGAIDLITFSQEYSATQVPDMRELVAYKADGTLLRKWELPWCGSTNDVQKIFPAVANLDDDVELEIVAVSGCNEIAAFDVRKAEPKWRASGDGVFLTSPVIGDIDGNGRADIVVAATAQNEGDQAGVYIFNGDGQRWRGWPVLEEYSFEVSPALGDLDHDGRLEIVLPSVEPSALHVLQWDGFEADGWPIDAFHNSGSRLGASLADIDGDGYSEILTPSPGFTTIALSLDDPDYLGGLSARNFAGQVIPFNNSAVFPALPFESFTPYRTHKSSPPLVGDFDGDGSMDLALCSLQSRTFGTHLKLKNWSAFYNWKLNSKMPAAGLEWPMFAHDPQNSGAYSLPRIVLPPPTNTTVAVRDRVIGIEDRELLIEPLQNDIGVAPLQVATLTLPRHGTVTQKVNGVFTYMPETDFTGLDEFTYTMRDSKGVTSTAKIIIRVKPVNDAPVAKDLHLSMKKNSSEAVFYVATDAEHDSLTFRVTDTPANGELWTYPNVGTYYPKRGFFGTEVFHYVSNDGRVDSAPATVTIDVINSNNPPTAVSQEILTKTNRAVTIYPVGNDLDDDELNFEIVTQPTTGSLELIDQSYRYTPKKDFLGSDSFTIRPFDGTAYGDPSPITVTIIATNAPPKAQNGSTIVSPNSSNPLVLGGSDPDGDPITYQLLTQPGHGVLTGEPPRLTYIPATNYMGPDKFTFRVSDSFDETEPATFSIQVIRQNRPPKAEDQVVSTATDKNVSVGLKLIDPDGDALRTVILKGPAKGLLYGTGTNFVYVPKEGSLGSDTFTYKAWDGLKFGNTAQVTVLISLPASQVPPSFSAIRKRDNSIELSLSTPNRNAFFIETSTNLVDWTTFAGPIVSSGERFTYSTTNIVAPGAFYRARRE